MIELSMNPAAHAMHAGMPPPALAGDPLASPMDAVELRHLKTPGEIARILHLRDEIDLSVHTAAGSAFAQLEKKETS